MGARLKMDEPLYNGPLARLVRSLFTARRPDPWPAELDAAVQSPLAVPLCLNCLCPQERHSWFCPICGYPTGDFVALMPYLNNFVVGEVLRRGVMGSPEKRKNVMFFLIVFSVANYVVFAPIYWYWMARRAYGKPICHEREWDYEIEDDNSPNP